MGKMTSNDFKRLVQKVYSEKTNLPKSYSQMDSNLHSPSILLIAPWSIHQLSRVCLLPTFFFWGGGGEGEEKLFRSHWSIHRIIFLFFRTVRFQMKTSMFEAATEKAQLATTFLQETLKYNDAGKGDSLWWGKAPSLNWPHFGFCRSAVQLKKLPPGQSSGSRENQLPFKRTAHSVSRQKDTIEYTDRS